MTVLNRYFARTRGPVLELTRHFFQGLVRSESFAGDDTFTTWLVQVLALLIAASWMLPTQLFRRYLILHEQPEPGAYLLAYSADTLWTILLMCLLMAFVTLVEWPALFPSRRDHLVLSPLPLTRVQIFAGKVLALGLFFTLFLLAITLFSSITLPFVSTGRWEPRGVFIRIAAMLLSSASAGYFVFLALVGLQGTLSLLIPGQWFAAISFTVQVSLLLLTLCLFPVLPYFPVADLVDAHSRYLDYLPPAWFWAWGEELLGNHHALVMRMSAHARAGLATAFVTAALTYLLTYWRLTRFATEIARHSRAARINIAERIGCLFSSQDARAVSCFISQTLFRGRQQKLVFLLVAGAGLALIVENSVYIGLHAMLRSHRDAPAVETAVIALPLTLSFFAMIGLRRVFRIPADLEANWIFRFLENPQTRSRQLTAVFGTFLALGGVVPILLSLPLELFVFHLKAVGVVIAELVMMSALAEYLMLNWVSIPFTSTQQSSSHVIHSLVSHLIELSIYSFSGAAWIYTGLHSGRAFLGLLTIAGGVWAGLGYVRTREYGKNELEFSSRSGLEIDALRLNLSNGTFPRHPLTRDGSFLTLLIQPIHFADGGMHRKKRWPNQQFPRARWEKQESAFPL